MVVDPLKKEEFNNISSPYNYKIEILSYNADQKSGNIYTKFKLGPLRRGLGLTLAISLRRILFKELICLGIVGFEILYKPELVGILPGVREDILELSLNLQKIAFKVKDLSLPIRVPLQAKIIKKGPCVITAADLILPAGIQPVSPHTYICSLNKNFSLNILIYILSGKGKITLNSATFKDFKKVIESHMSKVDTENLPSAEEGAIEKTYHVRVDSFFSPILNINYYVLEEEKTPELNIQDYDLYESENEYLYFDLTTNGSLDPAEALLLAVQQIEELFKPLHSINELIKTYKNVKNERKTRKLENLTISNIEGEEKSILLKYEYFYELQKPIEKLQLSPRAYNALKKGNFNSIKDLIFKKENLKNLPNFGKTSFMEVEFALRNLGIDREIELALTSTISKKNLEKLLLGLQDNIDE